MSVLLLYRRAGSPLEWVWPLRYLAFDFDGVLVDSTTECLRVCELAMNHLDPNALPKGVDITRDAWLRSMRPLVRGGGEYAVLLKCWTTGRDIRSGGDYKHLCRELRDDIENFAPVFYQYREELRSKDLTAWLALHEPVTEAIESLAHLLHRQRAIIVTMKDQESVLELLDWQGVSIDPRWVFDRVRIKDKSDALSQWQNVVGCQERRDIALLDDNPAHLTEVASAGFSGLLPDWASVPFRNALDCSPDRISLRELAEWSCTS